MENSAYSTHEAEVNFILAMVVLEAGLIEFEKLLHMSQNMTWENFSNFLNVSIDNWNLENHKP